ncbi:MAG: MarR family winged helix-turn-helix transcriptional regulator [Oscillospiraceae bacterium]|nr:MarR family winged helix-turn-helix transcriptional regulator [Oscillospiraceae bacterium]
MPRRNIGFELHTLNHRVHRFVDCSTHKKYIDNITGTNGWIIGYIGSNRDRDVYQRDFEKDFGITRSTASKVVNLMVTKGLIERVAVQHDARLKKLVLTDKAEELVKFMDEDHRVVNEMLIKGFSDEELDNLYSYIERMRNNIII